MSQVPEGQHFVAEYARDFEQVERAEFSGKPISFWREIKHHLLRNPLFYFSSAVILLLIVVATIPELFTSVSPTLCYIRESKMFPFSIGDESGNFHLLGTTNMGCDLYSRLIYGARTSLLIGALTMLFSTTIGVIIGALAGYIGGVFDSIASRIIEIFFCIPLVLGAVTILQLLQNSDSFLKMVVVITVFGWTSTARLMRSSVLEQKNREFVTSTRALGGHRLSILFKHVLPNAITPIISVAMVSMGVFIVADSGLTFLGLGLGSNQVSWGIDIANAQGTLQSAPGILIYPAIALAVTVLAFIFMGDAISEAVDPKRRK